MIFRETSVSAGLPNTVGFQTEWYVRDSLSCWSCVVDFSVVFCLAVSLSRWTTGHGNLPVFNSTETCLGHSLSFYSRIADVSRQYYSLFHASCSLSLSILIVGYCSVSQCNHVRRCRFYCYRRDIRNYRAGNNCCFWDFHMAQVISLILYRVSGGALQLTSNLTLNIHTNIYTNIYIYRTEDGLSHSPFSRLIILSVFSLSLRLSSNDRYVSSLHHL